MKIILIELPTDQAARDLGYYHDAFAAAKVKHFIQGFCRLQTGQWNNELLQLIEWQTDWIDTLYGWLRPDGTRRFSRGSLWIGKKNGKSSLCAAIALYHLFERPGNNCLIIASTLKQAQIIFDLAKHMVQSDPYMRERCAKLPEKVIVPIKDKVGGSTLTITSAKTKEGKAGPDLSLVIYDEIADFGSNGPHIWKQLQNSTSAQVGGMQLCLSTAQFDKAHFSYETVFMRDKGILRGEIQDLNHLPVVYAADDEDIENWEDPTVWKKANPSLGKILRLEEMKEDCARAKGNPLEEARFQTLRLNIWNDGGENGWLPSYLWDRCKTKITEQELYGRKAYVGIDISLRADLSVYSLVIPTDDGKYVVLPRIYIPTVGIHDKSKQDKAPYLEWIKSGFLRTCSGDRIDTLEIANDIIADSKNFKIVDIGYDSYNADDLAKTLNESGLNLVEVPGTKLVLTKAIAKFEKDVRSQTLQHLGNPCLSWAVANCQAKQDQQGRLYLAKDRCRGRIDPAMATIIGIQRLEQNENPAEYLFLTLD